MPKDITSMLRVAPFIPELLCKSAHYTILVVQIKKLAAKQSTIVSQSLFKGVLHIIWKRLQKLDNVF